MLWMKGGGWPFQSDPRTARELVTSQYGFTQVGEGKVSSQPVAWLVAVWVETPALRAGCSCHSHLVFPSPLT